MLYLSRATGERIHIGDEITIEVRKIERGKVTIGVQCPNRLPIIRGELIGTPIEAHLKQRATESQNNAQS